MKKIIVICFMLFFGNLLQAQNTKPVQWTFHAKKDIVKNKQIVEVKATIEKGWHIFTATPGGDGLLIPTTVTLESNKSITIISPATIQGKVHTENMEFMGTVNYYEGNVIYTYILDIAQDVVLKGHVEFQTCNDNMCLPPIDLPFTINLKK
jgi:DsbC/DsbD-like thiol-disulfide interchange protein